MKVSLLCFAFCVVVVYSASVTDRNQEDPDRDKRDILSLLRAKWGTVADTYGPLSYHPPQNSFDFWAFKRAILETLFQAIKAIKGGIIAAKGALLKANGHIVTTKGQILKSKGQAIINFGRDIAINALTPTVAVTSYGAPPPSAPATGYSYPIPSAPSTGYGPPGKPSSTAPAKPSGGYLPPSAASSIPGLTELPNGVQAGLIVLKPLHLPAQSHRPPSASYGAPPPTSYGAPVSSYGAPPPHDSYSAASEKVNSYLAPKAAKTEDKEIKVASLLDSLVSIQPAISYSLPTLTYSAS